MKTKNKHRGWLDGEIAAAWVPRVINNTSNVGPGITPFSSFSTQWDRGEQEFQFRIQWVGLGWSVLRDFSEE